MKKLLISIFLMLSMVVSGLSSLQFTPVASAINKSAVRCDFLGQYINPNVAERRCEPCPVDFYCPLVSGTEIENCTAKGFPESDCKEARKIFSTDKAIACPAGTTTKGFTFNTLQGTRITENGDPIFPVIGQGATDKTMCQAPDFKCPADKPVLLRTFDANGVAQEAKCFPVNTCADDQIAILKNGIPDCSVACKDTIVNGKCYQNCPDGEYLEVSSTNNNGVKTQSVVCKKIVEIEKVCPIIGQTPTVKGDLSTCVCTTPQVVSADKTKCELPVVPCPAPQTGNQPNCVNPPSKECSANTYGYSEPNCKPCPQGGTSKAGTVDSSGCVIVVVDCPENYYGIGNVVCTPCPNGGTSPKGTKEISGCKVNVIDCPENYYGENGNVRCDPCPNDGTSPKGTKTVSGCKAKENGGEGFCGGWWAVVCGGVVAGVVDCFLTHLLCNKPSSGPKIDVGLNKPIIPEVYGPNNQKADQYVYLPRNVGQNITCKGSSEELVQKVMQYPKSTGVHPDKQGKRFIWVETTLKSNGETQSLSVHRGMDGTTIPELVCLMKRYSILTNTAVGSREFMEALCGFRDSKGVCDNVLHGRNRTNNKECLDLEALVSILSNYDYEGEARNGKTEWAAAKSGTKVAVSPWFATKQEVYDWARQNKGILVSTSGTQPRTNRRRAIRKPVSIFNIFNTVKASAEITEGGRENVDASINSDVYLLDGDVGNSNPLSYEIGEEEDAIDDGALGLTANNMTCAEENDNDPEYSTELAASNGDVICGSEAEAQLSQEDIDAIVYRTLYETETNPNPSSGCGPDAPYSYETGFCEPNSNSGSGECAGNGNLNYTKYSSKGKPVCVTEDESLNASQSQIDQWAADEEEDNQAQDEMLKNNGSANVCGPDAPYSYETGFCEPNSSNDSSSNNQYKATESYSESPSSSCGSGTTYSYETGFCEPNSNSGSNDQDKATESDSQTLPSGCGSGTYYDEDTGFCEPYTDED
jgi:hypothetical protein